MSLRQVHISSKGTVPLLAYSLRFERLATILRDQCSVNRVEQSAVGFDLELESSSLVFVEYRVLSDDGKMANQTYCSNVSSLNTAWQDRDFLPFGVDHCFPGFPSDSQLHSQLPKKPQTWVQDQSSSCTYLHAISSSVIGPHW